jgi:hypothetical protein
MFEEKQWMLLGLQHAIYYSNYRTIEAYVHLPDSR